MKTTAKKTARFQKKRAARFAPYSSPAASAKFHRRPAFVHRGRLTEAAWRAISAVTSNQL